MKSLIDERLDEMAASAHQGGASRWFATLVAGSISGFMIGWVTAGIWIAVMTGFEIWSWFATRPQFKGQPVLVAQRLNHLINLIAEAIGWFVIGWLLWRTGTAQGEICAVTVWLSIMSYAQLFAYQSPAGFLVAGFLPAMGMLIVVPLEPSKTGLPVAVVWSMLLLAVAFISSGARQTMVARNRYAEVQERLARSESLYRVLADNVTDVIALAGADGSRRYISPSIEQALGYKVEHLMNTPNYTYVYAEDRDLVRSTIQSLTPEANRRTIEYRVVRQDGGLTWAETCFTFVAGAGPDGAGELVSVSRDVSARKAMETDLVEARQRAEVAAAAKADFLANMTHELRTPLNAIVGFSGLLHKSSALNEQDARYAKLINDASETLLDLVNSVLDLSRIDAGAVELDPEPFSPAALIDAAVAMVSNQAQAKGLRLTVLDEDAGPPLLGDNARLRQVLLNLLSNALKFTHEGGVTVLVSATGDGEMRRLRVEVRDTGVGVPEDGADLVFDRFAQADASVSRRFGGTGLGLAISKRIIELMGGRIGLHSVVDQGSTFWFEVDLPLASAHASTAAPTGNTMAAVLDRPLRLLLVEDVEVNRELVGALLQPFDVEIDVAVDGVEAIAATRRATYDLILMDVQMPVMDGLTATRHIRAQRLSSAPIIAMTANVLPEQIERCIAAGMDDHIGKPMSPAQLLEILARWSEGRELAVNRPGSAAAV